MFSKVIVGFDGSEQARDALMLGAALAGRDGELIVCCVHRLKALSARVDPAAPQLDRAEAERCLEEASCLLNRRMTLTGLPVAGVGAAIALQRTAEEQHADLLVLGSSHRGAVGRVLVGSVTEETLHGAPCPVAVAPGRMESVAEGSTPGRDRGRLRRSRAGRRRTAFGRCARRGARRPPASTRDRQHGDSLRLGSGGRYGLSRDDRESHEDDRRSRRRGDSVPAGRRRGLE